MFKPELYTVKLTRGTKIHFDCFSLLLFLSLLADIGPKIV